MVFFFNDTATTEIYTLSLHDALPISVRPVEGETTVLRVTVPVKPPDGVTVIVELPVAPVLKSAGEIAEIVRSEVNTTELHSPCKLVCGLPHAVMSTINEPAVGEEQ